MPKISHRLSQDRFLMELDRQKSIWRRTYSGLPQSIRRRRVNHLARSEIKSYLRVNGLSELDFESPFGASGIESAQETDPGKLFIVLIPQADLISESSIGEPASSRKRLRHILRETYRSEDRGFELLSSARKPDRGGSSIGQISLSGRTIDRGLYLEKIGAAILPSLNERQIMSLEASGALVVSNSTVTIDNPAPSHISAQLPDELWHLVDIKVAEARKKNLTGKNVLIGILDTGIDQSHSEFDRKKIYFRAFKASGEQDTFAKALDYGEHGTHVSGLCAGGNVGVAPAADLAVAAVLTRKTLDGKMEGSLAQVLAGLNWLAQGGDGLPRAVDVINASLGAPSKDIAYCAAVNALKLTTGVMVVAAIGNNGSKSGNHNAPASFHSVVAVGAADRLRNVASFSAWGPAFNHPIPATTCKPDFLAPGVDVVSCIPGKRYRAMSGTSMAAPIATGASALLIESNGNLRKDPDALAVALMRCIEKASPQPNQSDRTRFGAGHLDLAAAQGDPISG